MNRPQGDGRSASYSGRAVLLTCRVSREDITAMLDAYDSGMCDITTSNCLSRAFTRLLNRRKPVPLVRKSNRNFLFRLDDDCQVALPGEMVDWLHEAEIGGRTGPVDFTVSIPWDHLPTAPPGIHQAGLSRFPLVLVSN